jgi:hypothetical protein
MRNAALVVVLVLFARTAHADCALMGLAPKVLSAPDVVLAPDGGIVVGAVSEDRGSLDSGDIAVQAEWKIIVKAGTITPKIDVLAPGLAVYRASVDAFELKNGDETLIKATRSAAKRDALAAPKVKSIKFDAPLSRRSVRRVEVMLDGAPPAGAIALVLADAKGKAKSWGPVAGSVFYPFNHRDCMVLPNGTVPSKKGERVTLFWVDDSGRKSAYTKPVTIN